MKGWKKPVVVLVLIATLGATVLAGCGRKKEDARLKIGILPIVDVLPIYVAQQNGYFEKEGIQVEPVLVKSAQERDTLMQTGQVDGEITDLVSVEMFDRKGVGLKAVLVAMEATPKEPVFRILASPGSGITSPAGLKGVPIGISKNTIIEYVTYRLLETAGLKDSEVSTTEVSAIPVRYELLMKGKIKAATLPEPLASGAVAGGARVIVDDTSRPEVSASLLAFSTKTLSEKPKTVEKFLSAWLKAEEEINRHPDRYRGLLIEKGRVPKSVQESYRMPVFPGALVPTESQVKDVASWMKGKGLIQKEPRYGDVVDGSFLPER